MEPLEHCQLQGARLREIFCEIGYALWQLQELERVAAHYFVVLAQASKGMGLVAGNALIDKALGKTFGVTIHQIKKNGLLKPELEQRMSMLLDERNWLVHQSRSSSRNAVDTDEAAENLILRLDKIAHDSLVMSKEIAALYETYVKQHGITEEYIATEAKKILEQWHSSDSA